MTHPGRAAIKQPVSDETVERIYNFLKFQPAGVLATADSQGNPYGAVVYYTTDEDFNFTFTTKRDTQKHNNLEHNKNVTLVVYEPASQTTVQVIGHVVDISDTKEAKQAFDNMLQTSMKTSLGGIPPISKLYAGSYVAYALVPSQIRMAVFSRPDPGSYDMFEIINFG